MKNKIHVLALIGFLSFTSACGRNYSGTYRGTEIATGGQQIGQTANSSQPTTLTLSINQTSLTDISGNWKSNSADGMFQARSEGNTLNGVSLMIQIPGAQRIPGPNGPVLPTCGPYVGSLDGTGNTLSGSLTLSTQASSSPAALAMSQTCPTTRAISVTRN